MKHVHTNQDGFWEKVNEKYQKVQVSIKSSLSSRTRLTYGIDCTITFDMAQQDKLQSPKKGDLFVGLRGIGGGFKMGETYEILENLERDNMPMCKKADGSGLTMYIHTRCMGVVSQQDRLRVGDRVEIIDTRPYSWVYDNFGTVLEIDGDVTVGLEKNGKPYSAGGGPGPQFSLLLDAPQLRKIKPTPREVVDSITEIKVGDTVMVTAENDKLDYTHNLSYGDILIITNTHSDVAYYVYKEDGVDYCVYREDVTKVMTPKKRPCSCGYCKNEFNLGDCGLDGCSICAHVKEHYYVP